MPARTTRGLFHVSKAPTADGTLLDVAVSEMEKGDALWWDEHVQPWIDRQPDPRADKYWNWPWRIFNVTKLAGTVLRQVPAAFVVGAICASGEFIPCVMSLLVERYPDLNRSGAQSVFVWYLSPAPEDFFRFGRGAAVTGIPKALMAIGMDVAVTHSYNLMQHGRLGLHAAPEGGQPLIDWYENPSRGGLKRLPGTSLLPAGWRRVRGNDGRYFYHDERTAHTVSVRLDPLR